MLAGKVLKDDDKLEAYKIQNGHTIHMVKGAAKQAEPTPTPQRLPQMGTGLSAGNMADTIENHHHVCYRGWLEGMITDRSRDWPASTRSRAWASETSRTPTP